MPKKTRKKTAKNASKARSGTAAVAGAKKAKAGTSRTATSSRKVPSRKAASSPRAATAKASAAKAPAGKVATGKTSTTRKISSNRAPATRKASNHKAASGKPASTNKATLRPIKAAVGRKPVNLAAPAAKSSAAPPRNPAVAKAVVARPVVQAAIDSTSKPPSLHPPKAAMLAPSNFLTPGDEVAPTPSELTVGGKAPAFNLPRDGGERVSLASHIGRKLVLFFYPRASTPGCTKEAMDFSRLAPEFTALSTDILGVSADSQRAQEGFRDKHELTVPLLSDEAHAMLQAYNVWGEKSLYGRTFYGIIRTTVLVGEDGRVIHIWHNVKVDGHAEAVLEYVRSL